MSGPKFPRRRDDGSCAVSARFETADVGILETAASVVTEWLRQKAADGVALHEDLREMPKAEQRADNHIEITFEVIAASKYWKDWLVALTQRVSELPGLKFECFNDLVANAPHPASIAKP